MGDIKDRIYLYYAKCEEHLHRLRGLRRQFEERRVDWADYGTQISQQFYNQKWETMVRGRASLESVLPLVKHEDYLTMVPSCSLKRVYNLNRVEDFMGSHYLYNRDKTIDMNMKAIDMRKALVLAMQA